MNIPEAINQISSMQIAVEQGELNALQAYCELKRLEKILVLTLKAIQDEAISEAEKYGEKTIEAFGCEITKKAGAGTWNFKHISKIQKLNEKIKDYQELSKDAYKLIEKGRQVIDDDGVIVEPAMFIPGKDTISVKVK